MNKNIKITCTICNQGTLRPRKIHRLGNVLALIGYLFLIASIPGFFVGISLSGWLRQEVAAELKTENKTNYTTALAKAGFTPAQITAASAQTLDLHTLSYEQREAHHIAEGERIGANLGTNAGSAIALGSGFVLIIFSMGTGTIGYLLILKKKVLQCSTCRATIAAS